MQIVISSIVTWALSKHDKQLQHTTTKQYHSTHQLALHTTNQGAHSSTIKINCNPWLFLCPTTVLFSLAHWRSYFT